MKRELNVTDPLAAKVIERRKDGSALVEVPVLTVQDTVDFSITEGGGSKKGTIPDAALREMADNFTRWPRPVGVGFSGIDDGHQRDKAGPQLAFARSARYESGTLWVVAELDPAVAGVAIESDARNTAASAIFSGMIGRPK